LVLRFDGVRSSLLFEHLFDKLLFVKVLEVLSTHEILHLICLVERKKLLPPLEVFNLRLFDLFRRVVLILLSLLQLCHLVLVFSHILLLIAQSEISFFGRFLHLFMLVLQLFLLQFRYMLLDGIVSVDDLAQSCQVLRVLHLLLEELVNTLQLH